MDCSESNWKLLTTHTIRLFPLHFSSRASPCATRFRFHSTHFCKRLSRPQGHSAIGRILCQWIISLTPAGIEQATFRFVGQHLNHWTTAVPTFNVTGTIVGFEWHMNFLHRFSKNTQISNFMNNLFIEAELFHLDGQAGVRDEVNSRFSQFCKRGSKTQRWQFPSYDLLQTELNNEIF